MLSKAISLHELPIPSMYYSLFCQFFIQASTSISAPQVITKPQSYSSTSSSLVVALLQDAVLSLDSGGE